MANQQGGGGALNSEPLDAGPEQGGSNMGGLGSTGAIDRERDPEAEGYVKPKQSTAREAEILKADHEGGRKED